MKHNSRKAACEFSPCENEQEGRDLCPALSTSGLDLAVFTVGNNPEFQLCQEKANKWNRWQIICLRPEAKSAPRAAGMVVEANFPEYLQNHL